MLPIYSEIIGEIFQHDSSQEHSEYVFAEKEITLQ